MRVGIVGSRSFNDYWAVYHFIDKRLDLEDITLIVSGGAEGVDTLAQKYAQENEIPILIYYPKWKKFDKAAGPIRNEKIVKMSDIVFAFWDGKSPGTRSSINLAKKHSIECLVCDI